MESGTRAAGPNGSNVAVVVMIDRPAWDRSESVWSMRFRQGKHQPNPLTFGLTRSFGFVNHETIGEEVG